ncbi:probable RNA-binding protein 19 [Artemia franciscana]|uniref:RRM domain-containing protein n=1 Tax=Artemia franciscana TaxID=6661 RepID=A0AA88HKE1_ARTSF|nr:hypothetical protein QYM36_014315 [Artemia franciscana]
MTSSRLILKNLPPKVTEQKLRELFSAKGTVTDVQLKYSKDGKFRHFGFIGFKTAEEAESAQKYFDNSFVGQVKISVEPCENLGDVKAFKKHGKGKVESEETKEEIPRKEKNKHLQEIIEKAKNDPKFAEYLEAHKKDAKAIWENDVSTAMGNIDIVEESNKKPEEAMAVPMALSDLDYLRSKIVPLNQQEEFVDEGIESEDEKSKKQEIELITLKVRGLPFSAKKKDIKKFFKPIKLKSLRLPPKVKGVAYIGVITEKEFKLALNKNRSILGGNRITVTKYVKSKEESNEKKEEELPEWKQKEKELEKEESVGESGRIFVRNLCYDTTEDDLQKLFGSYGKVTEVHLPIDKYTRKVKGFATVSFLLPEHAVAAYSALDGTIFEGRMLHLLPAKAKEEKGDNGESLSYKEKKEKSLKKTAGSSHNWNTLFLSQNAIAEVLAARYNVSKQEVLDPSGQHSLAVRLALGETQVVNEIRQFLEEYGVVLDAFNRPATERSKCIMLAKNLPFGTTEGELREIFNKYGELGRLLLPPYGITAIIEYLNQTEAKLAFRKLAYTRFKNTPLYLEWAPVDVLKEIKTDGETVQGGVVTTVDSRVPDVHGVEKEGADEGEIGSTLFVKNINFNTMEGQLKLHFTGCGDVVSCTIATKKDPKNPTKKLSMGYGFVTFSKKIDADKALKTLQRALLDGHALELKRSNRTVDTNVSTGRGANTVGKQTSSKILVRNVPFEATLKEIQDLFKPFGEIKALRLPKKVSGTGSHRGFAFVEFLSNQDAKRAFESLCQSTHLYGRRLVLEWAEGESTVEELRQKTAAKFLPEGPKKKKTKWNNEFDGVLGDE